MYCVLWITLFCFLFQFIFYFIFFLAKQNSPLCIWFEILVQIIGSFNCDNNKLLREFTYSLLLSITFDQHDKNKLSAPLRLDVIAHILWNAYGTDDDAVLFPFLQVQKLFITLAIGVCVCFSPFSSSFPVLPRMGWIHWKHSNKWIHRVN